MRVLAAAFVAATLAGVTFAVPVAGATHRTPRAPLVAAPSLAAALLRPTPILDDVEYLSDVVGGRPTGTPAIDRATRYMLGRFRIAGYKDAHFEDYRAERVFIPSIETAEISNAATDAPEQNRRLRIAQMPNTPATPGEGLEAEVVDVGYGDRRGFARAGTRVRHRWVLVHTKLLHTLDDLFGEYEQLTPLFATAHANGAVGVLVIGSRERRLLYRHVATFNGSLAALPGAIVEREGAERIARLLARGYAVRVRAALLGRSPTSVPARNVVAELPGRGKASESIVLGAHLDSWDLGRGAQDNGCNSALVLDVARAMQHLAATGKRPRRSVRFVLYSGEEQGLFGSLADVRRHRGELDRVRTAITVDIGSAPLTGFSTGGRPDLDAAVNNALLPLRGIGRFKQTNDAFVGTDNYDYMIEGVPTLVGNQPGEPYVGDYHAESDTYDKVDRSGLKRNAAVVATLVWGLADAPSLPRRQTRAQIDRMMRTTGLGAQMRTFGLWAEYANGVRGRALPSGARPGSATTRRSGRPGGT